MQSLHLNVCCSLLLSLACAIIHALAPPRFRLAHLCNREYWRVAVAIPHRMSLTRLAAPSIQDVKRTFWVGSANTTSESFI